MAEKRRGPQTSLRLPPVRDQRTEICSAGKMHLSKTATIILAIEDLARKNSVEDTPPAGERRVTRMESNEELTRKRFAERSAETVKEQAGQVNLLYTSRESASVRCS